MLRKLTNFTQPRKSVLSLIFQWFLLYDFLETKFPLGMLNNLTLEKEI